MEKDNTRDPKRKIYADYRIPTDLRIQRLLGYPDRRINTMAYTMTSSGIKLGTWDYLKSDNIRPIEKEGKGCCGCKSDCLLWRGEECYTFISQEAYGRVVKKIESKK